MFPISVNASVLAAPDTDGVTAPYLPEDATYIICRPSEHASRQEAAVEIRSDTRFAMNIQREIRR
jgi:hypothetical protein